MIEALSAPERRALLALARAAVTARVGGDVVRLRVLAADGAAALGIADVGALESAPHPSGVFVTLDRFGSLRGCIGHLGSDRPLQAAIVTAAAAAACEDPRFPPVGPGELPTIELEISLLTPLQRVDRVEEIEVGRDGLVIESGRRRGLLLPQVATEWRWDREMFLRHTCIKAALGPDAWQRGALIWRFQAEVFGERAHAGTTSIVPPSTDEALEGDGPPRSPDHPAT